jgi:hypothetical protein
MKSIDSIFLFITSLLTIISSSVLISIYLTKKEFRTLCFKILIMMSVGNILYSLIWVICIILYYSYSKTIEKNFCSISTFLMIYSVLLTMGWNF